MSICYHSCKTQNFTGILQKALLKNFTKLSGNHMFRSCRPTTCSFVKKETLVHRFSIGSLEKFVEQVFCITPSLTASKSKFNIYKIDIPYPEILSFLVFCTKSKFIRCVPFLSLFSGSFLVTLFIHVKFQNYHI